MAYNLPLNPKYKDKQQVPWEHGEVLWRNNVSNTDKTKIDIFWV